MHLSPKERFGYVALAAIILSGGGFVAAQKLHRPAEITLHETQQPPVNFDHGTSRPTDRNVPAPEQRPSAQIVVDVAGAVVRPSLVTLPSGARVDDAVRGAGGPTEDANIDQVNLAARLTDGAQVYVPFRGSETLPGPSASSPPSGRRSSRGKQPTAIVDINTADLPQLTTLPGIGNSIAQRIIEYRIQNGPFHTVDDLLAVQGLGKKRLDQIRQWLVAN